MRVARIYRSRAVFLALVLATAACKSEPGPAPTAPVAPPAEAGRAPVDDALAFLEAGALTYDGTPTSTKLHLYSWTTTEQADEIRRTKVLLSRTESPTHGASTYDHVMQDAADAGDPVAKLLRTNDFQKSRFAWTRAWPTRMGWPGEKYGDVLLSIVIRNGAYVAKRDPIAGTWDVVTTTGSPVAVADLLAHPERLGAVYFETDGAAGAPAYREIIVCNESQVESFSFGMASDLAEIDAEIVGIETTAAALREHPAVAGVATRAQTAAAWKDPVATAPVDAPGRMRRDWLANVALDNDFYTFDPLKLDAIAASLRAAKSAQPPGSYFAGSAKFAGQGTVAPPPTVKVPPRGTYNGTYMLPRRRTGAGPH